MQIPAPVQDLHLPLAQRLEAKPVVPVTPVVGVAEQGQALEPHVALQWTQPVFKGERSHAVRTPLAAPLPMPTPGFEPQGADREAMLAGRVHPALAQGLATWLLRVTDGSEQAKPVLGPPLSGGSAPKNFQSADSGLVGPGASAMSVLWGLYQALAGSPVFAAHRLAETWLPKPASSEGRAPEKSGDAALQAFQSLARPAEPPTDLTLTQWVSALAPDSPEAQQAARMLSQGQMAWQTELAPGVPLSLVREDAWRVNPEQSGSLEKGASLRVEVDLPNLGRMRIVGSQWGGDLALHIELAEDAHGHWARLVPQLTEGLQARGVHDVRVASWPKEGAND